MSCLAKCRHMSFIGKCAAAWMSLLIKSFAEARLYVAVAECWSIEAESRCEGANGAD